ncbi:MAG: YihY/virulence factor BrkB family protein [Actinobacteria bacterium]|nr:YihY/virulence factor BrkB family protein [Actinomycetota bacterium]
MHRVAERIIDRAPARLRPGVELTVRTVVDAGDDRLPGLAAEVAFFVLLTLPPLLLAIFGTLGALDPVLEVDLPTRVTERTVALAGEVLNRQTVESTVEPTVRRIFSEGGGGIATIGFVITVLVASRALRVVATAITVAYDLEATRPAWQQRLWGLGLTLVGMLLGLVLLPIIVAGPDFGGTIVATVGVDLGFADLYRILYWPVAGILAWFLIASLYHFVAPWWTPWHRDLPGAALAMILWFLGSMALRAYANRTISARSIYEPIAGPLVLMLWLYVSAFAVLLGAELNAEIEKMWPTVRPAASPPDGSDHT